MAAQNDGVRFGDDRVVVNTPNWDGMDADTLFHAATASNDPGTGEAMASAWVESANKLANIASDLMRMLAGLTTAWEGAAAGDARDAMSGLAEWGHKAGQTAAGIGSAVIAAATAAQQVKTLPPPKQFSLGEALTAAVLGGPAGLKNDIQKQSAEAEKVRQEQVSYLRSYTAAMSAVDSHTPTFEPAPPPTNPGGGDSHHQPTGGQVNYHSPSRKITQGTSTGAPGGPFTGAMPGGAGAPGAPGDRTDDQGLESIGPIPGFPGGNTGTSGYTGGSLTTPGLPGGGLPHPSAPAAGSGGFGGNFGSFTGGPGAPGQGSGTVAPGERSGSGTGRGMGAGGGAFGEEAAARGRGLSTAGRTAAGGPMGAGTGAHKEDDDEHERPSYLVEADPEGTFGTDEPTAPPVIGQD